MKTDIIKESKIIDYIVNLGFDVVKDKINDEWESKQVRDRLRNSIKRQQKINWSCTREESVLF